MTPEEYRKRLADKLLKAMSDHDWNASELSRRSGINTTSMNSYIAGLTFPAKENRERIARGIFGISPEELDAEIEDRPIQRQSQVEEVSREIRLMDDDEFWTLYDEVARQAAMRFRRLQALLQDRHSPES